MRFLKMFGVLFSVWFFFATLFLTIGGIWDSGGKADAAIVFGADRNLSKTTKSRLDHSVELFKQQRVAHIVLMAMGEGESMKDYLLSKDIPADAIVLWRDKREDRMRSMEGRSWRNVFCEPDRI